MDRRVDAASGTGGAGTLDIVCDGRICRSEGFSGGDRMDPDTEILVWLDRDGDDVVEWDEALSDPSLSFLE